MNTSAVSLSRTGLSLLLTGQMLPLIDTSITNVALESITRSLQATTTQLELIVALYGITFAVCLALGSKLGDNYGRRRLFMWGVAFFGVASLFCGLANSIHMLLGARILQGAGAALIVPQILATLHVTLKGSAHAKAISLYGGIGGIAFIVGQMGGGWLVSADIAGLGWRNAFFINVPVCLLVLAFSRRHVPETASETRADIDWLGTVCLAAILCCLLFPMALGPETGWPWQAQAALFAILPLGWWMRKNALRQELRHQHPLLPPRLLRLTSIRFGILIALLFFSAWSGFMFCMALTLQMGLGMAPWESGNSFIALGAAYFISACYAPRLIARYSMGRILLMGLAIQIIGLAGLMMTFWHSGMQTSTFALAPATALIGYGQALIVNSFYRIGMRDISTQDAGAGSAILSTLQQATLGLGPAVLGALFLHLQHNSHGDYTQSVIGFLAVEAAMMLSLVLATLWFRRALNINATRPCMASK
ncbi:MFS transporter [Citrobacter koseri]|uniref:MFS transporter n=1 Tax=Citrobacter koseri TaxID=545 RepID=UPI003890D7A7|nr:MFS transporter [Citrobacter koseri]